MHIEKEKGRDTINGQGDVVPMPPKKRGRPPKNKDQSQETPETIRPKAKAKAKGPRSMQHDEGPCVSGVGRAVLAVPNSEVVDEGVDDLFKAAEITAASPCDSKPKPCDTWPSRSTFAGRPRGADGSASADLWDARRAQFYTEVPCDFWKDPMEREYWRMCVELDDASKAVEKFMDKMKPESKAPRAKGKAKAKSAVIWLSYDMIYNMGPLQDHGFG